MENTLLVMKINGTATLPVRATIDSAGYDIFCSEDVYIQPRSYELVDTGIIIILPANCYGRLASRSGLAVKHAIEVGAGVIDRDYRGTVKVLLRNFSDNGYGFKRGDRIAQLIIEMNKTPEVRELGRDVSEPEPGLTRGSDGFGSSGK